MPMTTWRRSGGEGGGGGLRRSCGRRRRHAPALVLLLLTAAGLLPLIPTGGPPPPPPLLRGVPPQPPPLEQCEVTTFARAERVSDPDLDPKGEYAEPAYEVVGLALGTNGQLLGTDTKHHRVLRIGKGSAFEVLAGCGACGHVDGPGSIARFQFPTGIAVDKRDGTVYVADTLNHAVRRISPDGETNTLAGNGLASMVDSKPCEDDPLDIPARLLFKLASGRDTFGMFSQPTGVAVDSSGDVIVTDTSNRRVRKIRPTCRSVPNPPSIVSTLAGNGEDAHVDGPSSLASFKQLEGVAAGSDDRLYVADVTARSIRVLPNSLRSDPVKHMLSRLERRALLSAEKALADDSGNRRRGGGGRGGEAAGDPLAAAAGVSLSSLAAPAGAGRPRADGLSPETEAEAGRTGQGSLRQLYLRLCYGHENVDLDCREDAEAYLEVVTMVPRGEAKAESEAEENKEAVKNEDHEAAKGVQREMKVGREAAVPGLRSPSFVGVCGNGIEASCGQRVPAQESDKEEEETKCQGREGGHRVYVTDPETSRVVVFDRRGKALSAAGTYMRPGYSDGYGTSVRIGLPQGIAIAGDHSIYFADSANNAIRKISLQPLPAGYE